MARLFDDAQTEYLRTANFPAISEPFTLAAWFYSDSLTVHQPLISVGDTDGSDYHVLRLDESADDITALSYDGSNDTKAYSTINYTVNTWHHGCAVFAASNSRAVYLDGGSKGTNTTDIIVSGADRAAVGTSADSTPYGYMSGSIAEVAIWDVALTDAEVAILAEGYSPLFVRPQNLVAYWPLIRDEDQDRVGGYDLTAFNAPSIASHPPMLYPAPPIFAFGTAAAPPVGAALPVLSGEAIHSLVFGGVTVR